MARERDIFVPGLNFYQPPRHASHESLAHICTDPLGIDWTKQATHQCYGPLAEEGALNVCSFDAYATLRHDLGLINPAVTAEINHGLARHGIGDSFIHAILPDLDLRDKRLLVEAGQVQFEADTGVTPKWFWAPESALDNETLLTLSQAGYEGVLCAPHQVGRFDGQMSDNRPTRVRVSNGQTLVLLAFDRPVSNGLAFDDKSQAETFIRDQIKPAFSRVPDHGVLTAMTDGETFGHHYKWGDKFLSYLVLQALAKDNIEVMGITELQLYWESLGYDWKDCEAEGVLNERTAWSCGCGELVRWHGACSCTEHGEWKGAYYNIFKQLNLSIRQLVTQELGDHDRELAQHFSQALYNPSGVTSNPNLALLSARASALAARTSCATFFGDPHTSGQINTLYATQAIMHLEDAGLVKAAGTLRRELSNQLAQITDPIQPDLSLYDTMSEMLDMEVTAN